MAPRTLARSLASSSTTPVPTRSTSAIAQPASSPVPQLRELRRQWKWAAFSQFFHTFAQLIALDDVTLVDVEDDLTNSTMVVLPRLMQRLLVTLTQDRKISVENWQTALRKQYLKRDPGANPIGVEVEGNRYSRAVSSDVEPKEDINAIEQSLEVDENTIDVVKDEPKQNEFDELGQKSSSDNSLQTLHESGADSRSPSPEKYPTMKNEKEATEEATSDVKDWGGLSMLEKLECMHTLIEWHFQSPSRLRSIMRSEDEYATWRIEPIGYDSKRNAYWLIGPDRLWIQRVPSRPPKKTPKRKATKSPTKRKAKNPRIEISVNDEPLTEPTRNKSQSPLKRELKSKVLAPAKKIASHRAARQTRRTEASEQTVLEGNSRARAAKTKANVKLDIQARQLAAAKAEIEAFERRATTRVSPKKAQTPATRKSRRLHNNDSDEEWQQVPPEWLMTGSDSDAVTAARPTRLTRRREHSGSNGHASPVKRARPVDTDIDSDESELTELSDDDPSPDQAVEEKAEEDKNTSPNLELSYPEPIIESVPVDFIEWETICISLQEWECVAEPFARATHYLEKSLYRVLVNEIVPSATELLRELEMQRSKEEVLMNRKRSSRLAIRESEKETARLAAEKQAEEEEKMARQMRAEARANRDAEERLKREKEREKRRIEREERESARSRRNEETNTLSKAAADPTTLPISGKSVDIVTRRNEIAKALAKHAKSGDDWELGCEVCGANGINNDDGSSLMCCGNCGVWQHIACHDSVDKRAGRPPRNWEAVEFICQKCRTQRLSHANEYSRYASVPHPDSIQRRPVAQPTGYEAIASNSHPSLYLHHQNRGAPTQLDKGSNSATGTSKYDINQTPRFTFYQPSERSYVQHPTSFKHLLHPQPIFPNIAPSHTVDHRTTNDHNQQSVASAQSPEITQPIGFATSYIPYSYPKVPEPYSPGHSQTSQSQSYIQQQHSGPNFQNQTYYHPQA